MRRTYKFGTSARLFGLMLSLACRSGEALDHDSIPLKGVFVPFGMCLTGMEPADQVRVTLRAGYSGLGIAAFDPGVIHRFAILPDVVSGKFRMESVLWWSAVDQPVDQPRLNSILPDAKGMDMAIWMMAMGRKSDPEALSMAVRKYAAVAEICRKAGVRLVVYPHAGTVIETVEESLDVLDSLRRLGHPEVKTSIHLCHELKAGNGDRLERIVAKSAPFLALATISGAEPGPLGYRQSNWDQLIQPLDRGSWDVRPFLLSLSRHGYAGPIELHTYNLKKPGAPDYDHHLERSLKRWRELVDATTR